MAKHSHVAQRNEEVLEETLATATPEKLAIEDMPLETLRDYRLYNEEARKLNKKLRLCRHPIKQCPVELHPHQRVRFHRNDQPQNPLPVFLSDEKIHFEKTLVPGKDYDLPEYIVDYLSKKGDPIWGWVENPDGSRETKVVSYKPRFSLTNIYRE